MFKTMNLVMHATEDRIFQSDHHAVLGRVSCQFGWIRVNLGMVPKRIGASRYLRTATVIAVEYMDWDTNLHGSRSTLEKHTLPATIG